MGRPSWKGGKSTKGGKSKAKGGKQTVTVVKTIYVKGGKQGKGKGKGKGGKKGGKGKGKERVGFSALDEATQSKIMERWQARAEREGRNQIGGGTFQGTCIWRCKSYGWIVPSKPQALPKKVKEAMATMTAELREKQTGDSN